MRWCCVQLLMVVWLVVSAPAQVPAQAQSTEQENRIGELEERVRQLEDMVQRLLRERSGTEAPVAGEPAAEAPPVPTEPEVAPAMALREDEPAAQAELPMAQVLPTETPQGEEVASTETRLPFSGYMDYHFNKPRDEPGTLDFHRFVLLFGHSFSNRIQFWSELELEPALVEGGGVSGELELEQAYLDFLLKPWLNVRTGIMLTPVGLINERHEPPAFNGVERPFVDTVIIPTTWFDSGAGFFGDLGHGFTYKAYAMAPLDSSRFNAEEGARDGRQKGFLSVTQNPAYTGRLEYHGFPGTSIGGSFWTGKTGFATPGINPRVNVVEVDGRASVSRFDFRGQFAQVTMDQTAELNALLQRTAGVNPNIAERMRGAYLEGAFHLFPRWYRHDLVAFARYEDFDTQNKMAPGFLPLNEFDRTAWVTGLTYYPEPDVALKFDYTFLNNKSSFIKARDSLNLGVGWWF